MSESIDQLIENKGMTAPRITPEDVEANIQSTHYFTAAEAVSRKCNGAVKPSGFVVPLNLLTFCVIVLNNGFTVTGESACASPENFDEEIGRKIARKNAVEKIWPLMGYELKTRLSQ